MDTRGVETYLKSRKAIRYYLRRHLKGRDADVDDLEQEVFIRVLKGQNLAECEKPLAYLYVIARNVLCDHHQRQARDHRHVTFNSELVTGSDQTIPDPNLELESEQRIAELLRPLKPKHAALLTLTHVEEFTNEEAAAVLRLSFHAVEKYLSRAKARIREGKPHRYRRVRAQG